MGTSLSGLTPATTFDGLLKTSDNDAIGTDLKTIGTGDGTDSQLKLATNATQMGNIQFVSGNVIATASPSTNLRITSGGVGINGDYSFPTANTRLHVKGSGTTSATTSLLVQNSAGTDLFSIKDDGLFTFNDDGGGDALTIENGSNISQIRYNDNLWLGSSHGSYVPTLKIDRLNGLSVETNSGSLLNLLYDTGNLGIGETTPTARLQVKGSGNSSATNAFFVENSTGNDLFRVVDNGLIYMSNDNYIFSNSQSQFNNKLGIGTTPDSSAQLHVKGSGATSATTALLVENSAGTDLFKVDDSGASVFSGQTIFQNNVKLQGANDTSTLNNLRFVVPGSAKSLTINKDYSFTNDASALVDIQSTTQGFLPPRMTDAERDAITNPAAGLMIYDTSNNQMNYWNGSTWIAF